MNTSYNATDAMTDMQILTEYLKDENNTKKLIADAKKWKEKRYRYEAARIRAVEIKHSIGYLMDIKRDLLDKFEALDRDISRIDRDIGNANKDLKDTQRVMKENRA